MLRTEKNIKFKPLGKNIEEEEKIVGRSSPEGEYNSNRRKNLERTAAQMRKKHKPS